MPAPDLEQAPSFVRSRPAVGAAYDFAARSHSGQRRESDAASFIVHPLEVGALLDATGSPEDVIVAGVLHDVLEKTAVTPEEIRDQFGSRIANLVIALTEDPSIEPFAARKAALTAQIAADGPAAAAISWQYALLASMRAAAAVGPKTAKPGDGEQKLGHYVASLESLESQIPDHPLVRQLRFELETLDALPPGRRPVSGVEL